MTERIMVVATHPDDETLGCGGTILKLKQMGGKKVFWTIVTNMFEEDGFSTQRINARQREIEAVAKFYNFSEYHKLNFPTARLDTIPQKNIIDSLGAVLRAVRPNTLFIQNQSDVHSDHRIAFNCLMSSVKTFKMPFVKRVLMYETLSETENAPAVASGAFTPNSFSDITDFIEAKIKAMSIYRGEMDKHPFPRSKEAIRALATFRGTMIGSKYAEAFQILRDVW